MLCSLNHHIIVARPHGNLAFSGAVREIELSMHETREGADVYLALGSNIGDRRSYLKNAVEHLRDYLTLLQISSVYETEPVGVTDQPMFLNLVLRGETVLTPKSCCARSREWKQVLAGYRRSVGGPASSI